MGPVNFSKNDIDFINELRILLRINEFYLLVIRLLVLDSLFADAYIIFYFPLSRQQQPVDMFYSALID